jgi:hypothetical protein
MWRNLGDMAWLLPVVTLILFGTTCRDEGASKKALQVTLVIQWAFLWVYGMATAMAFTFHLLSR